jgi:thymidine kinase
MKHKESNWECDKPEIGAPGYLELILGPMKSGKTSRLIQIYRQNLFCNISTVVINHIIDKRYHDTLLSNHDEVMIPCTQAETISELWPSNPDMKNASVILINEGHFFSDLFPCVIDMVKKGKKVYVSGLDGDYKLQKFGSLLDLIPHCDAVYKLTSLCGICKDGTAAIFSLRLSNETAQTVVGSSNYVPVCRKCYLSKQP